MHITGYFSTGIQLWKRRTEPDQSVAICLDNQRAQRRHKRSTNERLCNAGLLDVHFVVRVQNTNNVFEFELPTKLSFIGSILIAFLHLFRYAKPCQMLWFLQDGNISVVIWNYRTALWYYENRANLISKRETTRTEMTRKCILTCPRTEI